MVLAEAWHKWLDSTSRPSRSKGLQRASACCRSMPASSAGVTPCSRPAATAISLKLCPAYSTRVCTQQHSVQTRSHSVHSVIWPACAAGSGQHTPLKPAPAAQHLNPEPQRAQHDLASILHQNLHQQHSIQTRSHSVHSTLAVEPGYLAGC